MTTDERRKTAHRLLDFIFKYGTEGQIQAVECTLQAYHCGIQEIFTRNPELFELKRGMDELEQQIEGLRRSMFPPEEGVTDQKPHLTVCKKGKDH